MIVKLAKILFIGGIVVTLIGLIGGFSVMFIDPKHSLVKLLTLVPFGFLATFTGLSISVLHGEPRSPAVRPPDLDDD